MLGTLVGGVLVGVVSAAVGGLAAPVYSSIAVNLLLLVLLLVRPRGLIDPAAAEEGAGMITPPRRTWLGLAGWVVVLVVLLLLPGNVSRGTQEILLNLLLWVGIAQAWNIIGGIGGQLSLGHSVFVGTGGYTLAMFVIKAGMPWPAALLLGGVLSGALAWLLSYPVAAPVRRLLHHRLLRRGPDRPGLDGDLDVDRREPGAEHPARRRPRPGRAFQVIAALAVLACVVTFVVLRSTFGLRLMAVRDDEAAAAALGVSTRRSSGRPWCSARSSPVCWAVPSPSTRSPSSRTRCSAWTGWSPRWSWSSSAAWARVAGPVIGAFVIYYLVDRALESQPVLQALLSGVLVIAVIVLAPNGIVGVLARRGRRGHRLVRPPAGE